MGEGVGEIEPDGEDGGGAGHIQPEPHDRTQGADENEPVTGMGMQQHHQEILVAVAQTADIDDEVAAAGAGEGGVETGAVDVPDGGYAAQDDQMSGRVIEVGMDDLKFTPRVPADTRTCSSLI
ncbi:hypothetical protein [Streptomyces sp. WP-1]|uniref:hypothetical protein n=1 Tax=Streptomyces sp. WP-1 TaxID=3041497 RepID=UPI00264840AC|nr:hypothetical protein [Streptomyces sp. WP-1]WKE67552.1 hypothetical protein QHG49_00135 [Streptomyces sp. WP-1]